MNNNCKKIFYKLKYSDIFIIIFILLFSNANTLLSNFIVLSIVSIWYFFVSRCYKNIYIVRLILITIFVFIFYGVVTMFIFDGNFQIKSTLRRILYSVIVYSAINRYKTAIIYFIEKYFFYLVVINLFFFILQCLNYDLIFNVVGFFDNFINSNQSSYMLSKPYYKNMLIYTINSPKGVFWTYRNSGFFFEPGLYGFYLAIFLFINLVRNRKIVSRKNFIYVLSLLTTQSTTALLSLLVIIIVVYYRSNKRKNIFKKITLFLVSLVAIIFIWRSPIVGEKIKNLYVSYEDYKTVIDYNVQRLSSNETFLSLGRFAGLYYEFDLVMKNSPFLGFFNQQHHDRIDGLIAASGLAAFIRTYGFIGLMILTLCLYNFSKITFSYTKSNYNKILFQVIFFIGLFSFGIQFSLIFWLFIYYPLAIAKEKSKFGINNKILL